MTTMGVVDNFKEIVALRVDPLLVLDAIALVLARDSVVPVVQEVLREVDAAI